MFVRLSLTIKGYLLTYLLTIFTSAFATAVPVNLSHSKSTTNPQLIEIMESEP